MIGIVIGTIITILLSGDTRANINKFTIQKGIVVFSTQSFFGIVK